MIKFIPLLLCSLLLLSPAFSATELDYMEYATDGAAQTAYVTSDSGSEAVVESQTLDDNGYAIGYLGAARRRQAQSFTLSQPMTLTKIIVKYGSNAGTPSGNMTYRIETDDSNDPSGSLAHANATKAQAVTADAENTVDYTDFAIAAGVFWIVTDCDDQQDSDYWRIRVQGVNPYADGEERESLDGGSTWGVDTNVDLWFEVYGTVPNLQCFSEDTIVEQGTYSLKGVALITNSLNDTLTRTVNPTIDLSGLDNWEFDIYASRTGGNIKVGIHDSGGTTTETTHSITDANTWEPVSVDISGVSDANKDVIDSIIITPVNADAENTFYLDDMYAETPTIGQIIMMRR